MLRLAVHRGAQLDLNMIAILPHPNLGGARLMCNTSTYFIRPSSHLQRPSQVLSLRSASISNRTCFAPLTSVTASKASSTQQVQRDWHVLPDGTKLEVLTQTCDDEAGLSNPPLLMLHGAGHAAWCYMENFMPYFADRGHNTYAVSFRCQGNSDRQSKDKSAGTLASHSADLEHFISTLPKPPVILAHSFGGLIAQRYLLGGKDTAPCPDAASTAGLVLLGSAPPYGNGSLVGRTFRRRPFFSVRLTWGFITRSYARSMPLFRDMFMSSDIPVKNLQRYYQLLQENMSPVQLVDLRELNKQELPLQFPGPDFSTPVLALCGDQDVVVDLEAAEETAAHFGQGGAIELKGLAHDIMLDTRWQQAASIILDWLQQLKKAT